MWCTRFPADLVLNTGKEPTRARLQAKGMFLAAENKKQSWIWRMSSDLFENIDTADPEVRVQAGMDNHVGDQLKTLTTCRA
jgi:hypothetical protein